MKVIDTRKMFSTDYLQYLKDVNEKFYGQERCINIDGILYMPLDVAVDIGYSICVSWIEEVE